ncbi:MAG: hypothetical protein NVS9B3_07010 [Gemmatimonadaceae bacterium]
MRRGFRDAKVSAVQRAHLFLLWVLAQGACSRDTPRRLGPADTTAAPVDACTGGLPLVVTAGGIGPIKIGGPLREATDRCTGRDTVVTLSAGTPERGRVLTLGGHSIVVLGEAENDHDASTISRIVVADPAFRTDHGIGVRSSVGDLRKAHGQICAALREGAVVVTSAAIPGLSFATTASTALVLRGGPRALERDPGLVPDSAKVTTFWIDEDDPACGGS